MCHELTVSAGVSTLSGREESKGASHGRRVLPAALSDSGSRRAAVWPHGMHAVLCVYAP